MNGFAYHKQKSNRISEDIKLFKMESLLFLPTGSTFNSNLFVESPEKLYINNTRLLLAKTNKWRSVCESRGISRQLLSSLKKILILPSGRVKIKYGGGKKLYRCDDVSE